MRKSNAFVQRCKVVRAVRCETSGQYALVKALVERKKLSGEEAGDYYPQGGRAMTSARNYLVATVGGFRTSSVQLMTS
jgi:hypothetical protein